MDAKKPPRPKAERLVLWIGWAILIAVAIYMLWNATRPP